MWLLRIAVLIFVSIHTCTAADSVDTKILHEARSIVANEISIPLESIGIDDLSVFRKTKDVFVCGHVPGRRFLINMGVGFKKPIVERVNNDDPVFNLVWNLQCNGVKDSDAMSQFGRDLDESICTVKDYNWRRFGTRGIRIQGICSCQSGRILLKVYEDDRFLGHDSAKIEAGAFTIYIDNRPIGDSIRIEQAFSK